MGSGIRLCWCLLFAVAIVCSARNTIFLSGDEAVLVAAAIEGRSLKVSTDDYSDPSANHGHDPKNKAGGGSGRKG